MTANNDSSELEALFDSIAADVKAVAPAPKPATKPMPPPRQTSNGDNDELQALFDSVSSECSAASSLATSGSPGKIGEIQEDWPGQESVFNRIGHMARQLHDTLRELGYDKLIEQTVSALPDAKDRLAYVANLTEQAACRVLNATDIATPLVETLEKDAMALGGRWDMLHANQLGVDEFKRLAADTRAFLKEGLLQKTQVTQTQLTEIMMAQDFQDLTGQVIKKIVGLAQTLESGLMGVLLEVVPETRRTQEVDNLMNGPVINAEGRTDVVVNQQQVDDLLDSLGF